MMTELVKLWNAHVTPLLRLTLTDNIVGEVSRVDVCYLLDFHIPVDQ